MGDRHGAVDTLVAAWGVYDRSRTWPHGETAPSAEGAALRRWLTRLTPASRAEVLTVHDDAWVQLTLAMAAQRASQDAEGLHFFVDVEQPPALRAAAQHGADVPVVCYRRPAGITARLNRQRAAGEALESGVRVACNDAGMPFTLSLTLDAVADGDELLRHLDELSWGQCLTKPPAWRPDGSTHAGLVALGGGPEERWVEMPWLQMLGFYSLGAHIANRLEVAIWSRWRSASRRSKDRAVSGQAALPARLARLAATPALQQHAGVAQAAVARRLGAALRRRAGASEDWAAMKSCLEAAVAAMSALAGVGSEALLPSLVWQPLHLACTRTGSLLAQCGSAAVSAVEVAVADAVAAQLLRDEQADRAAIAADAARKAALRSTQAAAAERARVQAAAAKVTSDAMTRVLARAAAEEQAAQGVAHHGQQVPPRRPRPLPGWMPSVSHHQGSAHAPARAAGVLERVSSTPVLGPETCEPGRSVELAQQGMLRDELDSPVSPGDGQQAPWGGYHVGSGDAPTTWSAPTTPGHDFGDAFDGGLFWSKADLMQMQMQRRVSATSDVSSEDSGYLTTSNSSVAAWREALVGRLLVDTPEPSPGRVSRPSHPSLGSRSGMSSPLSVPRSPHHRRGEHHTLARSLAGSPTSELDDGSRSNSLSGTSLRRSRGSSAEPKRPQSPLTLQPVHLAAPARNPASRATPPRPPPPSDAFEPRVLFSAAQLRRLTAPAASTALSSEASPFAGAMAARAAFWSAAGEGTDQVTTLGEHLLAFWHATVAGASAARPARLAAVHRVTRVLQDLWPRARTRVFGSESLGLSLPSSDVDVLVQLPLVRQLPPIEEAGILEGRNGISESVLKTAFRRLGRCEWVVADSLKCIDNTAVPIISLAVAVGDRDAAVKLDLSFDGPHHQGVASGELVRGLLARWPVLAPLICCLKQFLSDRSLHHAYTGGLSSYGLTLLCAAFVKHAEATGLVAACSLCSADALARPEVVGTLFADFLHFYGHVLDPRKRMVALAPDESDGGPFPVACLFPLRTREALIDVLHIADPLQGSHVNAGRNCFRYVQIQRAFAEASTHLQTQPILGGLFGLSSRDPV